MMMKKKKKVMVICGGKQSHRFDLGSFTREALTTLEVYITKEIPLHFEIRHSENFNIYFPT